MNDESNYWRRTTTRRVSRRGMMRGASIAGAGVATAALVGCGDDDDDDGGDSGQSPAAGQTTTAAQPKNGGKLILHMGGSPRSLDPHFDTFPANTAITNNTNNGLLQFAPDLSKIDVDLATGMPEQPDPLTYTIKLQPGVKFHDVDPVHGREMTSEDVKYSLERQMTDEAGKFQHAYFFKGNIESITTPDPLTVSIKASRPFAPMISYLASPWTQVICREVVEADGDLTKRAIGTGPFIFKEWQKDVRIDLVKNPNYWKPELPHLDELSFLIAIDPDTSATLFIDRQVLGVVTGQSQLDRVKDGRDDAQYESRPSQFWRQMRMPPTTQAQPYPEPFDDIRVREAIVRAVDKKQVLDLVYSGDGVLTNGPILPIYANWTLKEELAGKDLKKSKDLLSQAGQSAFSGEMIWATGSPQSDQVGEVLKEQMKEIGVTLDLKPMELAAYYNQTYAYKYTFSHHVPLNNPDPDENLSSYFGRNSTFYKHYNPAIFDIIDKQAGELDTAKRQQIVQDAQKMIVLDFPMAFMYTTNNHMFTDPKVKGWFYSTDLYNGRVHNAWIDA